MNSSKEKPLTLKDIEEGEKIYALFSTLDDLGKSMAKAYISALGDKELADKEKEPNKAS